jgi:hypothetical protein
VLIYGPAEKKANLILSDFGRFLPFYGIFWSVFAYYLIFKKRKSRTKIVLLFQKVEFDMALLLFFI